MLTPHSRNSGKKFSNKVLYIGIEIVEKISECCFVKILSLSRTISFQLSTKYQDIFSGVFAYFTASTWFLIDGRRYLNKNNKTNINFGHFIHNIDPNTHSKV